MSSSVKYLPLLQLIAGVLFFSNITPASSTDCAKCDRVRATFNTSSGTIGGWTPLPAVKDQPENEKIYQVELGKRIPITYAPETSCGTTHATLGCCSNVFFFRRGQNTPWQMGKSVPLQASDDTSCDLGDGTCGCADCTKGAGCQCSGCYSPAVAQDVSETDVFPAYKAWTKQEIVFPVASVPPGENVVEAAGAWVADQLTTNNGWTFLGWRGAGDWTAVFKDTVNTTTVSCPSDSIPGPVERDTAGENPPIPGRFVGWTGTPEKKPVPVPGTGSPEKLCDCASRQPPKKTGAVQDSVTIFLWSDPSSEKSDPGSSAISGPEEGGGGSPDGSPAGVPLRIDFGLDRSSSGLNLAILSYSTQLDDSVPFAIEKFQLLQPFAEPGAEPVIVTDNPVPGITRRMVGLGTIVDLAITADGSSASLTFKDAVTGNTDAVHLLERILGAADHDPGVRHTITRNGQTQVTTLYGQTTASGGRTWKVINPNGDITAGITAPYDPNASDLLRSEGSSHLKIVSGEEILLDSQMNTYRSYSFGERLIASTRVGPDSQSLTTTNSYYNSGNPVIDGLLQSVVYPDGSWIKKEYDAQTGKLKREYMPWLSTVTTPADATLENSRVITHVDVGIDESWEIESIQGVVTSRNWTRHKWDQLDPLVLATNYEWQTPLWRVGIPARLHVGDYAAAGKILGVSPVGGQAPTINVGNGTISDALRQLCGIDTSYLADEQHWAARCKHPASFNLYERHIEQARPATIVVTCGATNETTDTLNVSLISEEVLGLPEEIFASTFYSASGGTAQQGAQSLYDYLVANAAGYLVVSLNLDNATVTISSLQTNAQQKLAISCTPNTFTPDKAEATGTDYAESWQLVAPCVWMATMQKWQASIPGSLSNQIPSQRQISLSLYETPETRIAVADHAGKLDLALGALVNGSPTYSNSPLKFNLNSYAKPSAFLISEKVWTPGTPFVPAVPATGATSAVTCANPYIPDSVTVSVEGLSQTYLTDFHFSSCTTAAELAAALSGAINMDFGGILSASSSDGLVTVNTVGTGSSAWFNISGGAWGVFSASGFVSGSGGSPEIPATEGHDSSFTLASCDWVLVPSTATPQTPSPLGDLNLFNGSFDTTMTQRFTSDYNAWDGSLVLRDANTAEGVSGDIRRSVDARGRVTLYTYDRGTYDETNQTFNWSQTGQAVKQTIRTYAADPDTFQLLAQDPVYRVTMTDYQGLTRVEQTWKDSDLVLESTHDYDAATRDRLWTKEGSVKIYEATRDTAANHLTQTYASGIKTRTQYTTDGQVDYTAKLGYGGRSDIVTHSDEDALTSTTTTTAGNLQRRSSSTRDSLGRLVSSTDENGFNTSFAYELNGRRTLETRSDGSTRITENYLDGRLKSVRGTGVVAEYHEYGVDADGNLKETIYLNDTGSGSTRSPRWRSTTTNGLGWVIAESQPAPPVAAGISQGVLTTRHFYNAKGQRIRTEHASMPDQLYAYDLFGRQSSEGIDLNGNHVLDLTGISAEPVTSTLSSFEQVSGSWFEKTVTSETASSINGTAPRTRTSLRLLGGALYDIGYEYGSDGLVTTSVTSSDPGAQSVTTTVTTNRTATGQSATRTKINGLLMSETSPGVSGSISYDYDDLERPVLVTDLDGVQHKTVYADASGSGPGASNLARSLVAEEQVKPAGASAFSTERSYAYHSTVNQPGFGRVSTVTQADSNTVSYTYDRQGHPIFVGGNATYPVRYLYNDFGEMAQMHTYRNGAPTADSVGDVTTWTRDPATGVLLAKIDAANAGTTNLYDAASRLRQRTLARKTVNGGDITITYGYDDVGRLTTVTYNDGTPNVTHTYYADGQLKTTLDAAGLHTYQYSGPSGQLGGETISGTGGLLTGSSWSTTFVTTPGGNGQNLRDVYTWNWTGIGSRSINFDYDSAGRLGSVTAFGHSAIYGYHPATGRKSTLTYSGAGLNGAWQHDERGRLADIAWKVGATALSQHHYGFDAMQRRTLAQRETGETWRYGYNARGEVTGAVKKTSIAENAPAKRGLQYGYGYDLIGNRIMDAQHTPDSGTGLEEVEWAANHLSQITGRVHHASQWVFGHAKAAAQLSITGGGTVVRDGDEFTVPVSRTGAATAADWHSLDVGATLTGAGRVENGAPLDVTTLRHGRVWFPGSPESLAYDEDGNLTQDGRWTYTWDAENRLLSVTTRTDVATATGMTPVHLDFAYDAQGRRIRKVVYQFETVDQGPTAWRLKNDLRFLYDGWNLVAEIETAQATLSSSSPRLVRSYAWGTDLSGNLQGAGGVGGLLLVQRTGNVTEAPCYDGNGNISAYVRVATGVVTSRHDYDAFGRPIWNELEGTGGKQQAASPFGFSTKYTDLETGWCYFGHRHYSSELGRWLSRDPIGERGGVNLYGMVENDPINHVDMLGLFPDLSGHGDSTSPENIINEIWAVQNHTDILYQSSYGIDRNSVRLKEFVKHFNPDSGNSFVFTCKYGWIDLYHFWNTARVSYHIGDVATIWGGIGVEVLQTLGEPTKNAGASASGGDKVEPSYFSPEDLQSNSLGADFGQTAGEHDVLVIRSYLQNRGKIGMFGGRMNLPLSADSLYNLAGGWQRLLREGGAVSWKSFALQDAIAKDLEEYKAQRPKVFDISQAEAFKLKSNIYKCACQGNQPFPGYRMSGFFLPR